MWSENTPDRHIRQQTVLFGTHHDLQMHLRTLNTLQHGNLPKPVLSYSKPAARIFYHEIRLLFCSTRSEAAFDGYFRRETRLDSGMPPFDHVDRVRLSHHCKIPACIRATISGLLYWPMFDCVVGRLVTIEESLGVMVRLDTL